MSDTIFLNADYIVVEYIDLIKCPYMPLLSQIKHNNRLREILDIEQIERLDESALFEWYVNRKYQNPFMDLNKYPDQISISDMDKILDEQISSTPKFYQYATLLPLSDMLKVNKRRNLVKDLIIYHPHSNNFAKDNLATEVGTFTFMNDFNKIIDKTKENSTYFLSNIDLLNVMKDKGYLKFSSVTLPIEYRYNKRNMEDFKLDFESLLRSDTFKLSYLQACSFTRDIKSN